MSHRRHGQLDELVDTIQSQGRYTFDQNEVSRSIGLTEAGMKAALQRLQRTGRLVKPLPRHGFFVIVPPEFRTMGAPPLPWYLDALMHHLDQPGYYVGLLTAAEWHGASHYAVQETQVIVPERLRLIEMGRERIRFFVKTKTAGTAVEERIDDVGVTRVSTPEATSVDLVRYLSAAGGVSIVATALAEMKLESAPMRAALDQAGDVTAAQRLGYLLERAGQQGASRTIAQWLAHQPHRVRPLDPRGPVELGERVEPWDVRVNTEVEVGV